MSAPYNFAIKTYYGSESIAIPNEPLFDVGGMHPTENTEHEVLTLGHKAFYQWFKGYLGNRRPTHVAILVDDHTRATPTKKILPFMLDVFDTILPKRVAIKIIVAGGVHRKIRPSEIVMKLGGEIAKRYPVIATTPDEPEAYQSLLLGSGKTVEILKPVLENDIVIGVGTIRPHVFAGWSGGAKIMVPGVCGPTTIAQSHLFAGRIREPSSLFADPENPVRHQIEDMAVEIGLSGIVNAISVGEKLHHLAIGDPRSAHRAGVKVASSFYSPAIHHRADIVIAEAYPYDYDYWRATDALASGTYATRSGGWTILVAECRQGIVDGWKAAGHIFLEHGSKQFEELISKSYGDGRDVALGLILSHLAYIRDRKVIIVSKTLSENQVTKLGLKLSKDIKSAIARIAKEDQMGQIGIIRNASQVIPSVLDLNDNY